MSTETDDPELSDPGIPELTPLGKRIELLRFERRLSKRVLAQRAGTSRQQLWRVMTGKSELTSSLCARLSEVLEIDSRTLRESTSGSPPALPVAQARFDREAPIDSARGSNRSYRSSRDTEVQVCETLEEYLSGSHGLARTFETLPLTDDGRRLKRVLLDAIEDIAIARSLKLPQAIFDLRRAVVNDDA
jgi:transcriptional regulator with XRE-family HTH domain